MVEGVNLVQNKTGPGEKPVSDFNMSINESKFSNEERTAENLDQLFSKLSDPETNAQVIVNLENSKKGDFKKENYIEAFIKNPVVTKIFPDIMNWLNIGGNTLSFIVNVFNLGESAQNLTKTIASFSTKAFMIATSVINIVERCYAKNFLSALGYLNDIFIASTVKQDDTYLARGSASGTYNMANSLAMSMGKENFNTIDDHVASTAKGLAKFFKNLFSKDIIKNFINHENGMWAIFGGLGANIGTSLWLLSGKTKIPTLIRDICGVMMDIEQLNPGHLKAGRKNYFFSGLSLAIGTISDSLTRFLPKYKDLFVPLTFIFDGIGRHLLRLHQNERELKGGLGSS